MSHVYKLVISEGLLQKFEN